MTTRAIENKISLRFLLLLVQSVCFFLFERLLPDSMAFFSAYGVRGAEAPFYPLYLIPLLLLLASLLPEKMRPYLFVVAAFILAKSWIVIPFALAFLLLFFWLVQKDKDHDILTALWGVFLVFMAFFSIYYLKAAGTLNWFWVILHMSWALKLISWMVAVRSYAKEYSINEFFLFFFHPSFFFFTNDLNVLTPQRFFSSRTFGESLTIEDFKRIFKQTVAGLFFLAVYGAFQKYYFFNLINVGWAGSPFVGALVSIVVAIIFHGANSCIQVSMLNAYQHRLEVDMNRPWKAISPRDYWMRMHYYVREYIFEVIAKPIMTIGVRWNVRIMNFKLAILSIIYFIFSCTQIGYQPYRQDRTVLIGFLVTGVFVAMMAIPELFIEKNKYNDLARHPWLGRAMTFLILYFGYFFIFFVRQGF